MTTRIADETLLARALGHAVEYLRRLPDRHVGARLTRDEILSRLRGPLSEEGEEALAVLDALAEAGAEGTVATAGPRYFGFVIGGSLPVALGADWLTSAWDQNSGIFATSPIASTVEDIAATWVLDLLGLPDDCGVGFVTGCQMANFTALAAARHAMLRRHGWNVEEDGLFGAPRVALVGTAEAHVTIHTSARMLGLGLRSVHAVDTDDEGRMRPAALRAALSAIDGPIIVSSQAGNVNTGAVDPLEEIAAIAHEHGAWLHVDGAFGLWARASRRRCSLLAGAELADSWATDAHKWLNVPYDNGIAIVRDRQAHRSAMTVSAAYLEQAVGSERDELDWVPEFSRRARGVTVYAALRALGRRGIEQLVDRCCDAASRMAEALRGHERVEILNDVVLNQVLVRFGGSDAVTRETIARVQKDGTCWLAGTTWHGMTAMRISISNWATSEEDIDRSAQAILKCLG